MGIILIFWQVFFWHQYQYLYKHTTFQRETHVVCLQWCSNFYELTNFNSSAPLYFNSLQYSAHYRKSKYSGDRSLISLSELVYSSLSLHFQKCKFRRSSNCSVDSLKCKSCIWTFFVNFKWNLIKLSICQNKL